jgi:hypothetical protein
MELNSSGYRPIFAFKEKQRKPPSEFHANLDGIADFYF